jgi:lambda repressor-like predicted transcriptional regulator
MNKLPKHIRAQIISMLIEGASMRSVSRVTGVSINTVSKLLVEAGEACCSYHDETVRNIAAKRIQCDETWSFVDAKQKNVATMKEPVEGAGDVWTWTALDADSKTTLYYMVGGRDANTPCPLWMA